ncbi:MAG: MFS transporter [Pseudomonadota bacterium]
MTSLLTPLAHPVYRRLLAAQIVALFGTGLATVALGLLAYELAGADAGLVLGIALAIKMVAYVIIAPVAGAFATTLPRRRVLVAADLVRLAAALMLPFVDAVWQIFGLIFVLQAASAVFTPVFQATIPDVLEDEATYTNALSLSRLAYDLEALLSPAIAALLLLVVSFPWLFDGTAIGFLASALLVLSVRLPGAAPKDDDTIGSRLKRGLAIFRHTPRLKALLWINIAVAAAGAMVIVNTVVLVRASLDGGDVKVAVALAAAGAGSMIAALVLPRVLARWSDRAVMLGACFLLAAGMAAGFLLFLKAAPTFSALLVLWFVLGVANAAALTPVGRLLRRSTQAEDRPPVFAAQFALSHACWLITYPLAGWLGVAVGLDVCFVVLGGLALIASLAAWRQWPVSDQGALWHHHEAVRHQHQHVHDEHHQHEHEGWEGPEPHSHPHRHGRIRHRHAYVIDRHHPLWPQAD